MNIDRRGIKDVDTRCPVCRRLNDDGGHCFLHCKHVKKGWQALDLEGVRLQLLAFKTPKEIIYFILQLRERERNLTINFLWVWWDARNKLNAGEQSRPLTAVLQRTWNMASNTEYLQLPPKSNQRAARADRTRWIPPPADVLKINTDAAFIAQEKSGAWGFVIRDHEGHGVMAGSGRIRAVHDALAAEGEACLAAIYAAMDIGISRIILETDSF
jgi:hypothetical protein